MMRRLAVLLIASQVAAAPLMAATLVPSAGRVSVNSGAGFRVVTSAVSVKPGDRVMVGQGGQASIQYGQGCSASVKRGSAIAVSPGIPCNVPDVTTTSAVDATVDVSVLVPLVGGGALIGGIAGAVALGGSDNIRLPPVTPISP